MILALVAWILYPSGAYLTRAASPRSATVNIVYWALLLSLLVLVSFLLDWARTRFWHTEQPAWISLLIALPVAGSIVVYYAALVGSPRELNGFGVSEQFAGHIFRALVILLPVLFLAGTDLAEIAGEIGGFIAGFTESWKPQKRWPLALMCCIALPAAFISAVWRYRFQFQLVVSIPTPALLYALLFGLIVALLLAANAKIFKLAKWHAVEVPFTACVAAALFIAGGHELSNFLQYRYGYPVTEATRIDFSWHRFGGDLSGLQIAQPDDWNTFTTGNGVTARPNSGPDWRNDTARFYAACLRQPATDWREQPSREVHEAFGFFAPKDLSDIRLPDRGEDDRYAFIQFKERAPDGAPLEWSGDFWFRQTTGCLWVLGGISVSRYYFSYYQPIFLKMVKSLEPLAAEAPPQPVRFSSLQERVAGTIGYVLPFVLFMIAGNLLGELSAEPGQRSFWQTLKRVAKDAKSSTRNAWEWENVTPVVSALFYLNTVGVFAAAFGAYSLLPASKLIEDPIGELQAVLAVASGGALVAALVIRPSKSSRELLKALLALNVGLLLLMFAYRAYGYGSSLAEESLKMQGIVLFIALFWDLMMSGKEFTNPENHGFTREVRILLYAGYIMLLSTCILFFSSQQLANSGEAAGRFFEAENVVARGILLLGVPVLFSRVLVEFCRNRGSG